MTEALSDTGDDDLPPTAVDGAGSSALAPPSHPGLEPTLPVNPALTPTVAAVSDSSQRRIEEQVARTLARLEKEANPYSSLGRSPRHKSGGRAQSLMRPLRPLALSREPAGEAHFDSADLVALGTLGEGGMGVVELAHQPALEREVAVKRLRSPSADTRHVHSLLDEARVTGSLEHPNILPVHAVGLDPEHGPLVVMKRVQGATWSEVLKQDRGEHGLGTSALAKHLRLLVQVCNAVGFAHSRDIIHRDIKPTNVMLGDFGEVYVLDWGIALRLCEATPDDASATFGTPVYMAPEMVLGEGVDRRSDIYLLGACLHEILTGKPRHTGATLGVCFSQALASQPYQYPEDVPRELGEICNRACARLPDRRYQSAQELSQAIVDFLEQRDAHALVDSAEQRLEEFEALIHKETPDEAEIVRHYHEARFGLTQALELWPSLERAKAGLLRLVTSMLEFELSRANIQGAETLVLELERMGSSAPAELSQLLAEQVADRQRKQERLESLERDQDPTVGRAPRSTLMILMFIGLTAVNLSMALNREAVANQRVFGVLRLDNGDIPASIVSVLTLIGWRRLGNTEVNRRFRYLLLASMVGYFAVRICGSNLGLESTAPLELIALCAPMIAVGSPVPAARWVASLGVILGIAASLTTPENAVYINQLFVELVLVFAMLGVWRTRRLAQQNAAAEALANSTRRTSTRPSSKL
ncbi:MAG: serine/threonine-protein kinase [Polyangiaceae bacterium]